MENFFGRWGRILLVVVGAAIMLVAVLLIACFFTPGCLGYECIRKRRKESSVESSRLKGQNKENLKPTDVSYRSWRLGSLYENSNNGSVSECAESPGNTITTNKESNESIGTAFKSTLVQPEKQKNESALREFPTELTMSLQYLPPCGEKVTGKLVIGIEALSGLPPKQYNCTLEPYVALNIVKQSWSHRRRQKLHSFRTRSIRHSASPIYRETFVVADAKPLEVKEWILDITAHDQDRYANHTELCALKVPLKEVKMIFASPEIHLFNYKMKPSYQEYGKILLGVIYLPTAQKLTINVMKACDLKFPLTVETIQNFNPYVRIVMLNGKLGRKIKKRRTKSLHAAAQPEFNETLTFDINRDQLDLVQFLVVLCSKISVEESTNNEQPSDDEGSVNSSKRSPDVFIGKVALGKGVRGSTERLHWFSVLQNPRKLVTVWHTLK
ncbi:synaptotagmin-5 [Orussus abietinus]|uniref:synaptotagmin-5 n=1 Tax=Orussus abietinus TaxID=222816 RepID=UPI000626E2FF|nr:synaptotagmin-5 [Orussus abietinus]XP_012271099.1 synaptotagmin-5 [Orussus abietinus]XP_012271101.1 synaptotagmin-5 [Orussus abietinus]XP_012271102.1 synaptotagmin-5 [Orussus abietinus]